MKTQAVIAQIDAPLGAQAPDPPPGGGGGLLGSPMLFIVAMLLLMYALIIRPQQRRDKEQKKMLSEIERGDSIISTGGLHGRVTGVTDDVLTVEIANNVRVKLAKSAVGSRTPRGEGDKS